MNTTSSITTNSPAPTAVSTNKRKETDLSSRTDNQKKHMATSPVSQSSCSVTFTLRRPEDLSDFEKIFQSCVNVHSIFLEDTTIKYSPQPNYGSIQSLDFLKRTPEVIHLHLGRCCFTQEQLVYLQSLPHLEHLVLGNVRELKDLTFLKLLSAPEKLKTFDISDCDSLTSLEGLESCPNLTTLSITINQKLSLVSTEIFSKFPKLEHLDLGGWDKKIKLNPQFLPSTLTYLDISLTADMGSRKLSALIKQCPDLKTFKADDVQLPIRFNFSELSKWKKLNRLSIGETEWAQDPGILEEIQKALPRTKIVTTFDFEQN